MEDETLFNVPFVDSDLYSYLQDFYYEMAADAAKNELAEAAM